MVSVPEVAADLAIGCADVLSSQVHRHHAWVGQGTRAIFRFQCLGTDLEELTDSSFDVV